MQGLNVCGLLLAAYLLYNLGWSTEDTIEWVLKNGLSPIYNDIETTLNILSQIKTKKLSKSIPL